MCTWNILQDWPHAGPQRALVNLRKLKSLSSIFSDHNAMRSEVNYKTKTVGNSLVAQWIRTRMPMQGTWVQALVQEDPTCHGATKPTYHNYWACALELTSHNYWACVQQLLKPMHIEPMLHNKRSPHTTTKSSPHLPQLEKARVQQRRPNTAKNK